MASNKDILEAQRYNRRRLVTAFSAGMPQGREMETRSAIRPLAVGAVVAVILLVVALVLGHFDSPLPTNWQNSTLVVVEGTGSRYFTINGVLRPVTNVTSALLLSEDGSYQVSEVDQDTLEGIPRGSQIGLTGVPDTVPSPDSLASDQWLSCAMPQGPHTWVAGAPSGAKPLATALVTNAGVTYLVADGVRHQVDAASASSVLIALGLDTVTPVEVSAEWLNVFDEGSPLGPLSIPGTGSAVTGMPANLSSAVIGTVIEVEDNAATRHYVVTGNATVAPLSDTAHRMIQVAQGQGGTSIPLRTTVAEISSLTVDASGAAPSDWPETIGKPPETGQVPCARLVMDSHGTSTALVSLDSTAASQSIDRAAGASPSATPSAGAAAQSAGAPSPVTVKGGSGALVRTSGGGSLGAVLFVSDAGYAHSLGENPADSLKRLGWSTKDVVTVPAPWLALVPQGTTLTADTAWQTVGQQ